jgi:chromate transporter
MADEDALFSLLVQLVLLSLVAIGGVNTVLPELHRLIVTEGGWMSGAEFTALYALAQSAPGPNVIFVTLLGWQLAGLGGAMAATAAVCGPSFVIAHLVASLSMTRGEAAWFRLIRRALVPLTTGLLIASAWLLTEAAAHDTAGYLVTFVTAAVLLTTRINPLWLLAGAGGLGVAGAL